MTTNSPPPSNIIGDSAKQSDTSAERRQLTVMFVDLVGSTRLSEQIDPEELRDVVRAYQEASAEVIERHGGHVAQLLGDGLLVYFGYPSAHEDDAARAVRTGLEIVEAIGGLSGPLAAPLQVRVGIHTGQTVVGEMGGGNRHEQLALGSAPNIAARVQGIAEPDSVMISANTYRLVEGMFDCEQCRQYDLKGISTPMALHKVIAETPAHNRFEAAIRHGLTPLVGRERQLQQLFQSWDHAKSGEGQFVTVSGEAGIGKSRLVQELKDRVADLGAATIGFHCSAYHQNSALYPLIEHLQRLLKFESSHTPYQKLKLLEKTLAPYAFVDSDTIPLIGSLLSLPSDAISDLPLSAQQKREKTLETLLLWLIEESERSPLCCVYEDLHWADPTTVEFLSRCLERTRNARVLTVAIFRPEFTSPWKAHEQMEHIDLHRLDRSEVEKLANQTTGGRTLPSQVIERIVVKTDGVPLYVEELTKMIVESGSIRSTDHHYELCGSIASLAIPSTLQDLLMARLDRLGEGKRVAQLGATIGRTFDYEVLRAVSPFGDEATDQGLHLLIASGLISHEKTRLHTKFFFKHALVQDAAYESLLKRTRREYHGEIARILLTRFSDVVEVHPELLAHHYHEASLLERAIPYWRAAGERATRRSAHQEAIAHLTKALDALSVLPEGPERDEAEIHLQLALILPYQATKTHAAAEMEQVCARTLELYRKRGHVLEETPELFRVLRGLLGFYGVRGDFRTAHELAEQLLWLAQRSKTPALLLQAHQTFGFVSYSLGDLPGARSHFEKTIGLYVPGKHHPHVLGTVDDSRVVALGQLASTLWHLGYPDQARTRSYEALEIAAGLSHPFSLAVALISVVVVHCLRREANEARERAEALIELSVEHGFGQWLVTAKICDGYALTEQGKIEKGIEQLREGVKSKLETGVRMGLPFYFGLLANGLARGGQTEEGLAVVSDGLDLIKETDQRVDEAELHRIKGVLLMVPGKDEPGVLSSTGLESTLSEAEECFREAIGIARRQNAKSSELRATVDLARLSQTENIETEAHKWLARAYEWFAEGFDTEDLREAKALMYDVS